MTTLDHYNLQSLNQDYFRMIIFGESGSGKTKFLTVQMMPTLLKKYHIIFVITSRYNHGVYAKVIPNRNLVLFDHTTFEKDGMKNCLAGIERKIESTVLPTKNIDGHEAYKYNSLLIFDDALGKVDVELGAAFARIRHLQCSMIFLSNQNNTFVSPIMMQNSSHFVLFSLKMAKTWCKTMIKGYIESSNAKEAEEMATKIYDTYIKNSHTGSVMLDSKKNKIYYNKPTFHQ